MPGPPPKRNRQNKYDVPTRGEWQASAGVGWQHGPIPKPPTNLTTVARATWLVWFRAWYAAHWTPDNLPQLRKCIQLYDAHERGESKAITELRQWMDGLGITPYGQQKLRWLKPEPKADADKPPSKLPRLRVINE